MKFPEYPRPGKRVEETVVEILNWIRANNVVGINGARGTESPNGKTFVIKTPEVRGVSGGATPPLWPKLKVVEGSFLVSLSPGYINERIPGDADALACQEIQNLKWGVDAPEGKTADDLREFAISVGQQISVLVYVDVTGELGGDGAPVDGVAKIEIETEDEESTHYVPPCGDDADGTAGVYHYKLAVLRAADATHSGPWLELYLAGSHIDHFRDIPQLANLGEAGEDMVRIVKEFDNATGKFNLRSLKNGWGHKLVEDDTTPIQGDYENIGGGEPIALIPLDGGGAPAPPTEGPLKFRSIRGLTTAEADEDEITPQIVVSREDGEDSDADEKDTIRIRGNSKKGKRFSGTDNEIEWKDGLVTSEGNGDESGALDVILWSCDGTEPSSDPTTWTRRVLLRMSFANGILVGTNESFATRALADTREFSYIQDCCFIGDDPSDHR